MWNEKLLNIDANPKTIKGQQHGYLTGVLYLSPATSSGTQVCAFANVAKCEAGCLRYSGRGIMKPVEKARIAKTQLFFADRAEFFRQLIKSAAFLERKASKLNLIPALRLNGLSDISWENERYQGKTIFDLFGMQFYDYTKNWNRSVDSLPDNYHLTYSISGAYPLGTERAIARGFKNFAAVWRKRESIPTQYLGMPVTNGDAHDLCFVEPEYSVRGLYAKGRGRKDTSGFILD